MSPPILEVVEDLHRKTFRAVSTVRFAARMCPPIWLTQSGAAKFLGLDQAEVSRTARSQFRRVSEAQLLELRAELDHDVKIVVGPVRRHPGKLTIQFA
jgi:hypothetical protein